MGIEGQLPLDEDMIERAADTLHDLVGYHLKQGVTNPYIDADDYVKRLCRVHAEQTLNAAFYGVAKMQTWTVPCGVSSRRASTRPTGCLLPRHPELQGVSAALVGDTGARPSARAGDTSECGYDDYE